jgi:hypothetical protein
MAAMQKGTIRVVSGSGYRFLSPFPFRLHKMLSDVEERGDASIVSWMPDGLHFKVHNPRRFVEEIIPKAFKQKSLKSFQRQLHLYGFQRVQDGLNKGAYVWNGTKLMVYVIISKMLTLSSSLRLLAGAYWHENFVQDNREMSLSISRIKAPKRRSASQNSKPTEKKAASQVQQQPTPLFAISTTETMVFPQATHSQRAQTESVSPDQPSSTCFSPSSKTSQPLSDVSVAETYEWLCNVGLSVSAFDPVALSERFSVRASATELLECADEITSLFAPSPAASPTKETQVAPDVASLDAPISLSSFPTSQDMTLPILHKAVETPANEEQQQQTTIPDLLFDTALPTIENDNWALW